MMEWLTGSLWWVLPTGILGLIVLVWVWQEYEEEKSGADVGRDVGQKARIYTGGIAGFLATLTTGILGGLYEAGMSFGELGAVLGDIIVASPQLITGIGVAVLGWLTTSGTWTLSPLQYAGIAMVLLGGGAIIAMRANGDGGLV